MLRPHPRVFGRRTHILKLGCIWESLGEHREKLISGFFPKDSDFTGPGVMWTLDFFFLKLQVASDAQPDLRTADLHVVSPPWGNPVFRSMWPLSWNKKQPPGMWHLISEARLGLVSLTNPIMAHIMTLRFPPSLIKAQAPGHPTLILLKVTKSPIPSLLYCALYTLTYGLQTSYILDVLFWMEILFFPLSWFTLASLAALLSRGHFLKSHRSLCSSD